MDIAEKIIQSPKFPIYFQRFQEVYKSENKKRIEFYNKITPSDKAEFINGEIIMHSPATNKHLLVSRSLATLLTVYTQEFDLGEIYVEKALIALKRNDYEPDLCFFKKEKASKFNEETLLFPAPDLVVEIISKSTEKNDRGIKFIDYAFNGIPEYWIISPRNKTIEQYVLWEEKYVLATKTKEGIIKSNQIVGLELPVKAIFDKTENQNFLKQILTK